MKKSCSNLGCALPEDFIKDGSFRRKDDSKLIQRYRCKNCGTRFSSSTFTDTFWQKRRRINGRLVDLLSSGVSLRRSAILLRVNRRTIEKRLPFHARRCQKRNDRQLKPFQGYTPNVQIDDLITKENSKLKPLSVSLAVDKDRHFILGTEVSQIPAFGHLAKVAIDKYGPRTDEHNEGLKRLFERLSLFAVKEVLIESDEHQRYPSFVSAYFPQGKHQTFKSEKGCIAGQGELKKLQFDPLFSVNHACAMLRANINRLFRRTWCSTKDPRRLKNHLDIFIYFYNHMRIQRYLATINSSRF
jgi:transposase-like protein